MTAPNHRDLLAGLLVLALGAYIAIHAAQNYQIGSLGHIGPGMFPAVIGFGLLAMGAGICISAFSAPALTTSEKIDLRALLFVAAALLVFVAVAPRLGMVPGVLALVLVASFADSSATLKRSAMVAVVLAALAYVIFHLALRVPLQPFRWAL